MDRVLSYQTAMRSNNSETELNLRQFISKRTCTSITLSAAFMTLILGFLLGKFSSDRNHIIREQFKTLRQQDENRIILKNPHLIDLNKFKQMLTDSISDKEDLNQKYTTEPQAINAKIMDFMKKCVNEAKDDKIANINSLEEFLGQLVDIKFMLIKQCFSNLSEFIKTDGEFLNA